ncbi:unnamed protein product [Knipowitschia caucasica]
MRAMLGLAVFVGLISAGSAQNKSELSQLPLKPFYPVQPTNQRCWTRWFDRDDPSGTGDWETLLNLRNEYPGEICDDPVDVEARTMSGATPAAMGDAVVMNTNVGFYCKTDDQTDNHCNDYRVRFSCYSPYCEDDVCWTQWLDRDNPGGTGDWELLSNLRQQYPEICEKPKKIEVVTTSGNVPATATGQDSLFIIFSPTEGFVCKNAPGQFCRDYKVRFGCCCN